MKDADIRQHDEIIMSQIKTFLKDDFYLINIILFDSEKVSDESV